MTAMIANRASGRRETLFTLAVFLTLLAVYAPTWFQGLSISTSTIGAERVLRGEIPYRDFWTMYAPGHFYLLAGLFRLFGVHSLVEIIATSMVCAATGTICYKLVFTFLRRKVAAIACAAIFVAATFNAGNFKNLGSYPPAIFFVMAALYFLSRHYQLEKLSYLAAAGVATGAAVAFKHDVGGYTALAILAGLAIHACLLPGETLNRWRSLLLKVVYFGTGIAVVVLPIAFYFAVVAGPDIWQDLIIFPLTDFRFARPERYPGLFELDLRAPSLMKSLARLFTYINFTIPFVLLLCGLVAVVVAALKRKFGHCALGLTFSAAYLLHYAAAHVQINTHIITMSIYGALLGAILFDLLEGERGFGRPLLAKLASLAVIGAWFVALIAEPADTAWADLRRPGGEIKSAKVAGLKVSPRLAGYYAELLAYVDSRIAPDAKIFVGLHRHDVVVVGGNAADYFLLNRPIATRYHEIHPAIVDTAEIQREMIRDLQQQKVSLIILKRIKPDDRLDEVKRDFLRNLPKVGATDLDRFIQESYQPVRQIGDNVIWQRKNLLAPVGS